MKCFVFIFTALILVVGPVHAQDSNNPVDGKVIAIPLKDDFITLDGNLADWEMVLPYKVDRGFALSPVAGENDYFEFSIAADHEYFYAMAITPDKALVAGSHYGSFWNEDSIELYLNLTGDLVAQEYAPGIFQITISPVDIGNTDPEDITVSGLWSDTASVRAFIFKTESGWGTEIAIAWESFGYKPQPDAQIGFNIQMNGAIKDGGDREVKLNWSLQDTADVSWYDPSVFGTGVFVAVN